MTLLVEINSKGGQSLQKVPVTEEGVKIPATAGTSYRIVDDSLPGAVLPAQIRRVGDDLVIDNLGGTKAIVIVDFYFVCRFDYRSCELELEGLGGSKTDRVSAVDNPTEQMSDGSFLVWSPASQVATSQPLASGSDNSTVALRQAVETPAAPAADYGRDEGGLGWGAIAALLGGVALAGAAAGGGGGGSSTPPVGSDPAVGGTDNGSGDSASPGDSGSPGDSVNGGDGNASPPATEPPAASAAPTIKAGQAFTSTTPVIEGSAEANATLTLTLTPAGGSPVTYRTTVDAQGNWAIDTASLPPTTGALPAGGFARGSAVGAAATATDAAGNSSPTAQAVLQISAGPSLDTTPPDAPTVAPITGDDEISVTEAARPVTISGTAEAGSKVTVVWDDVSVSATAAANGNFQAVFSAQNVPEPGSYTVSVQATDAAGNVSAVTSHEVIVQPTSATATIRITGATDDAAPLTGQLASGAATNDDRPDLSGTLSRALAGNEEVHILRNGVDIGRATVSGTDWTYRSATLSDDDYTFAARLVSGNSVVANSTAFALTVDTEAPKLPVFNPVEGNGVIVASEVADGIQLTGRAEAGAVVSAVWGQETITGLVGSNGSYELVFDDLPAGVRTEASSQISVSAQDQAGNVGPARVRAVWVDGSVPTSADSLNATETLASQDFSTLSTTNILDENQTGLGGVGVI